MKVAVTRVITKGFTVCPGTQKMWNYHGNFRNQKAKTAGNKHYGYATRDKKDQGLMCVGVTFFHIV